MDEEVKTKVCTKCGEEKLATAEFFYREKSRMDGFKGICKYCIGLYEREKRSKNPEKSREYRRIWREKNAERERERHRKWRSENADKVRASRQKWKKENVEYIKEYNKKNKERINYLSRVRNKENPKIKRNSSRKWRAANPYKVMIYKKALVDNLSDSYVKDIIRRQFSVYAADVSPEFIQDKREQLQNYRQLKQLLKLKENG